MGKEQLLEIWKPYTLKVIDDHMGIIRVRYSTHNFVPTTVRGMVVDIKIKDSNIGYDGDIVVDKLSFDRVY